MAGDTLHWYPKCHSVCSCRVAKRHNHSCRVAKRQNHSCRVAKRQNHSVSVRSSGSVDPGWEHGVAQDERKKKVKCNYCGKIVSGGIYRLKQHLARVSGEVTYCEKAPEEVYLRIRENLEGSSSNKRSREIKATGQAYLNFYANNDEKEAKHDGCRSKGKQVIVGRNFSPNLTSIRSLGFVDPGWEHGVAQDERKKKVKCNYCEKIVSGGINRFKQHLARIPGEVAPCKHAPEDVYLKIKENMKWHRTGRRHRRPDSKDISSFYMSSDYEDGVNEQEEDVALNSSNHRLTDGDKSLREDMRNTFRGMSSSGGSETVLKRSRLDSVFLRTAKRQTDHLYKQIVRKNVTNKKSRTEVLSAICKFFYHAGVPLQAANSVYFQKMLDLVGQYGPGLIGPSSRQISGPYLQDEISFIKNHLTEYRASWAITGCSIRTDRWKDSEGKTLINFSVSCAHGMYFVSSVDATDAIEDASNLFKLLDKVVEQIGEENVVQVITENTPIFKVVGKMLEEKRRHLFWTPCAVYCIDCMLEDFLKIRLVEECMVKGQKITKFIYNHNWLLNVMKNDFTQGQELLRPAVTRCASSFATLQSLLDHRNSLKRLFVSNKWVSCSYSKFDEGKEVEKIVLNTTFWKKVQCVRKSVDPILEILQKVDSGNGLLISSIYNDMCRAKIEIKSIHGDDTRKYGSFWNVIDNHWNSLFCHPLYVAAYFLNPSLRYRPDFMAHSEVVRGLNECIVRLEPDNTKRISASMQISDYNSAKADFGTELAVSTRTDLDPAAWWQQHGINCLELQRIAVRVLSQTCTSCSYEQKWSIFDQIRTRRHNLLAHRKFNDLTYVHYNLRLREQRLRKNSSYSISLDSSLLECLLDDWIIATEKQAMQEDEEILEEMEHVDLLENELVDYEDESGLGEGRRGCSEFGTLVGAETLDGSNATNASAGTDSSPELKFYDDDMTMSD